MENLLYLKTKDKAQRRRKSSLIGQLFELGVFQQ